RRSSDLTEETLIPAADSINVSTHDVSIDTLMGDIKLDSIPIDTVHTAPLKNTTEQAPIVDPTPAKKVSPLASPKKTAAIKEPARTDITRTMRQDSILRQEAVIPVATTADSLINKAITVAQTPDTAFKDTTNQAY